MAQLLGMGLLFISPERHAGRQLDLIRDRTASRAIAALTDLAGEA
jgi:hypothetical protein